MMENAWFVYILRCCDDTLYTGVTNDLKHRLEMHNAGKGAKYTKGRGPLTLCYYEQCESKPQAFQREYQIKRLSRLEKLALCNIQEKRELDL